MLKFASHQYTDVFKARRLDEEMMKKEKIRHLLKHWVQDTPKFKTKKEEEASSEGTKKWPVKDIFTKKGDEGLQKI